MTDKSLINNKYFIIKLYLFYLCSILVLYSIQIETDTFLLLSGAIATVIFSMIIHSEFRSTEIKFTPISILSLSMILMMGFGTIYQGLTIQGLNHFSLGPVLIKINSLKTGYLMVVVGTFFQILAIQIQRPKQPRTVLSSVNYSKQKLYALFFAALFITQFLSLAFLGMISNYLNALPIAILGYIVFANNQKIKLSYKERRNFVLFGSFLLFALNITLLSKSVLLY